MSTNPGYHNTSKDSKPTLVDTIDRHISHYNRASEPGQIELLGDKYELRRDIQQLSDVLKGRYARHWNNPTKGRFVIGQEILNRMYSKDIEGNEEVAKLADAMQKTLGEHKYLRRIVSDNDSVRKGYQELNGILDKVKEKAQKPIQRHVAQNNADNAAPAVYASKEEQLPLGFTRESNIVPRNQGDENAKYSGYKPEGFTQQYRRGTFGKRLGRMVAAAITGLYFTLAPMPSLDSILNNHSPKPEQTANYNNALAANEKLGSKGVLSTDRNPFKPANSPRDAEKPKEEVSEKKASRQCVQPPYKPSPRVPVMPLEGVIKETGQKYTLKGGNALNEISSTGDTILISMGPNQKIPAPRIIDGEIYRSRFGIQHNNKFLKPTVEIKLEPGKEYSFNAGLMADATLEDIAKSCCGNPISNVYESDRFRIKLKIPEGVPGPVPVVPPVQPGVPPDRPVVPPSVSPERPGVPPEKAPPYVPPERPVVPPSFPPEIPACAVEDYKLGDAKTVEVANIAYQEMEPFQSWNGRSSNTVETGDRYTTGLDEKLRNKTKSRFTNLFQPRKTIHEVSDIGARIEDGTDELSNIIYDTFDKTFVQTPNTEKNEAWAKSDDAIKTAYQKLFFSGDPRGDNVLKITGENYHRLRWLAINDTQVPGFEPIQIDDYERIGGPDKSVALRIPLREVYRMQKLDEGKKTGGLKEFLKNRLDIDRYSNAFLIVEDPSTPIGIDTIYWYRQGEGVAQQQSAGLADSANLLGAMGAMGAMAGAVGNTPTKTGQSRIPRRAPSRIPCEEGRRIVLGWEQIGGANGGEAAAPGQNAPGGQQGGPAHGGCPGSGSAGPK